MNIDTVAGEGTNIKGRFKESLGDALGDPDLRSDGVADQASGSTRKAVGAMRDVVRDNPVVAALALVGLVALLGGLGRSRTDRV